MLQESLKVFAFSRFSQITLLFFILLDYNKVISENQEVANIFNNRFDV